MADTMEKKMRCVEYIRQKHRDAPFRIAALTGEQGGVLFVELRGERIIAVVSGKLVMK